MDEEPLIKADSLLKRYGDKVAVNGISFRVSKGEVFGIVGPNGAGKTTTVNMITGRCIIDGGELHVLGRDAKTHDRSIRKVMGVVSQDDNLDPDLSVYENLLIYSSYFGGTSGKKPGKKPEKRIDELLRFFDLLQYRNYNVMDLSGGMRRRLTIARGLVNEPSILILDEPTTGLDPQARHHTWDRLMQIKDKGITILLTTHYMEEVTKLCDRVMVMHNGTIMAMDAPQRIISTHYPTDVIEIKVNDQNDFSGIVEKLGGYKFRHEFTSKFGLIIPERFDDVLAIQKRLTELYPLSYPLRRPPNLEDAFLAMTGTELRENDI